MGTRSTARNLSAHDVSVRGDNGFQRRARLLQSLWRQRQGCACGSYMPANSPEPRLLGSRLTASDAESGANFLTAGIRDLVFSELLVNRRRAAGAKKLLERGRLLGDLLSSQPMCFNLFGELTLDTALATKAFRALWPDRIDRVLDVRFEWSPGRMDPRYLNNKTAADAFVEFVDVDGKRSFIAIETKYHEDMRASASHWKPHYDRLLEDRPIVGKAPELRSGRLQQVLLDHLLVESMLRAGDGWNSGLFVLVFPEPNQECATVAASYREHLTDLGSSSFDSRTLEEVAGAIKTVSAAAWVKEFERRYLDWERVPE